MDDILGSPWLVEQSTGIEPVKKCYSAMPSRTMLYSAYLVGPV